MWSGASGSTQPHDGHGHCISVELYRLGSSVQDQSAFLEDLVVQHPQRALLGLTEVVWTHDVGGVIFEINEDRLTTFHARRWAIGRVDHLEGGHKFVLHIEHIGYRKAQHLLHPGDVRTLKGVEPLG